MSLDFTSNKLKSFMKSNADDATLPRTQHATHLCSSQCNFLIISTAAYYRNPFAEDPLPKAFYHPTQQKDLSESEKQTTLSPGRKSKPEREILTSSMQDFLKRTNTFTETGFDSPVTTNFDETWPTSEQSTVSFSDVSHNLPRNKIDDRISHEFLRKDHSNPEETTQRNKKDSRFKQGDDLQSGGSSVLERYIKRFRQGAPMSREERQKAHGQEKKEFWWVSSEQVQKGKAKEDFNTWQETPTRESRHKIIPDPYIDKQTDEIQEKADRLLEKSSSSVASTIDPEVSTDGLGSSSGDITLSSIHEKPYRPSFVKQIDVVDRSKRTERDIKIDRDKYRMKLPVSEVTKPTGPGNDILYQWRLRRKMETARTASKVTLGQYKFDTDKKLEEFKERLSDGRPTPQKISEGSVLFTPSPDRNVHWMSDDQTKLSIHQKVSERLRSDPPIASPHLKRDTESNIEPHLHLMCDLLPCQHHRNEYVQYSMDKSERHSKHSTENISKYRYLPAERPDVELNKDNITPHPSMLQDVHIDNSRLPHSVHESESLPDVTDRQKYDANVNDRVEEKVKDREEVIEKENYRDRVVNEKNGYNRSNRELDSEKPNIDDNVESRSRYNYKSRQEPMKDRSEKLYQNKVIRQQKDKTQPVDSMIGQVVKNRLFDMSDVISSVESLPEGQPRQLPSGHPKITSETPVKALVDDGAIDDDDGSDNEFEDDKLLQMLRQQKKHYENQLKEIDMLLMDMKLNEKQDQGRQPRIS